MERRARLAVATESPFAQERRLDALEAELERLRGENADLAVDLTVARDWARSLAEWLDDSGAEATGWAPEPVLAPQRSGSWGRAARIAGVIAAPWVAIGGIAAGLWFGFG
jgi:hypothetical protein